MLSASSAHLNSPEEIAKNINFVMTNSTAHIVNVMEKILNKIYSCEEFLL